MSDFIKTCLDKSCRMRKVLTSQIDFYSAFDSRQKVIFCMVLYTEEVNLQTCVVNLMQYLIL